MIDVAALLPDYLAWSGDNRLGALLDETLVLTASDRLARVLLMLAERDQARAMAIEAAINQLPDVALLRVLVAPESTFRLGYDGVDKVDETAAYLEDAIVAEQVRQNGTAERQPNRAFWSALGDRRFMPAEAGGGSALDVLIASELAGIVVDFDSMHALGSLPHIAGQVAPIALADRAMSLERIGQALEILRRTGGGAMRMVEAFTRVIVVRSDPSAPNFYTSASSTLCLGRTVMRNPFVPAATPAELADGLVHEAIHCVCDLAEIRQGWWLIGDRGVYDYKVCSPWTGRNLDLHTFLQASWVWYGLWHFWAQAIEAGAVDVASGLRCLGQAYQGFAEGEAVDRLAMHRDKIRPAVMAALETAQATVRTRMDDWRTAVAQTLVAREGDAMSRRGPH